MERLMLGITILDMKTLACKGRRNKINKVLKWRWTGQACKRAGGQKW